MPQYLTPALFVLLLPLAAGAQDKCTVQGQAEQDRIIREFSSRRPAQGDKAAELTWSRNLNAALAAAAKRADECSRSNRPAIPPAAAAKEQDCLASNNRRIDELQKRYAGRAMTPQEQAATRAEETRLMEERMACAGRPSR